MTPIERPLQVECADSYQVVSLHPELHDVPWDNVEAAGEEILAQLAAADKLRVVMDLSRMQHMGSSHVALVLRIWKSIRDREGRMVVVAGDDLVRQVLQIAGLHKVWTIVASTEAALDELGVSRGARVQRRETRLLTVFAAVMALVAVAALAASYGGAELMPPGAALAVAFLCAAQGLVAGGLTATRGGRGRRALGMAAALLSLAVIVAGAMRVPATWQPQEPSGEEPVVSLTLPR